MTDAEQKLKHLQNCLGEKKLKQLGLIPCSTCRQILTQVMHISLPEDLENKSFLTSEDMATISQTVLDATHGSLNHTPTAKFLDEYNIADLLSNETDNTEVPSKLETNPSEFISSEDELTEEIASNTFDSLETNLETTSPSSSTSTLSLLSNLKASPELVAELNESPIKTNQDLVFKLLSILNQSHHITQDDLGIGYIYTPPAASPFVNALSCSECGRLYGIITHPDLNLIPLPVYLSAAEYEMLKGIYVDIFL